MSLWIVVIAVATAIAAAAALRWMANSGTSPLSLDDKTKIIGVVGGIVVGVGAVVSYVDTANREIKKPYNEKKLALCIEASDIAAALTEIAVGSAAADARNKARARFETLYWGSLAMFENADVEDKYVEFRKLLKTEIDISQLQKAALNISHACRQLVSDTWSLDLKMPTRKQQSE